MPRKGVAQVQNGGGIQGQVVGDNYVAPIGIIFCVVVIPAAGEDIGSGEGQLGIGKAREDALPLALGPIHAHVEPTRLVRVHARQAEIVRDFGRCRIAGGRAGEITFGVL